MQPMLTLAALQERYADVQAGHPIWLTAREHAEFQNLLGPISRQLPYWNGHPIREYPTADAIVYEAGNPTPYRVERHHLRPA